MYPLISTFIQALKDKLHFHYYLGTKGQVCQMKSYLSLQNKKNKSATTPLDATTSYTLDLYISNSQYCNLYLLQQFFFGTDYFAQAT